MYDESMVWVKNCKSDKRTRFFISEYFFLDSAKHVLLKLILTLVCVVHTTLSLNTKKIILCYD